MTTAQGDDLAIEKAGTFDFFRLGAVDGTSLTGRVDFGTRRTQSRVLTLRALRGDAADRVG